MTTGDTIMSASQPMDSSTGLVGRSLARVEDGPLLAGRGAFADDLGVKPGTAHAAILRSPYAHAEVVQVDSSAALALPGVRTVLTGEDLRNHSRPFVVGVKQPMEHWCLAVDRVRYMGEPVAVVVADDRYLAEDALDAIKVDYRRLEPIVDPVRASAPDAPVLHTEVGSNVVSDRHFRYGDPEAAFETAAHQISVSVRYPRNGCTPIEGYVVVADYEPDDQSYDVLANFQGPFTLHPVMALALRVTGNRLRLRTPPDSGGSFGVKQGVFPYIVAMCLAARKAGCPVKWVEDRLEHLNAATSATNRVSTLDAAVAADGTVLALRYDQLDDCGAYLRAPEPASLYRMHGHMTGPYAIEHLAVRNRVVLTNKTPTGLNRGFGGPQVYFALERLMQRIAITLDLDPLAVIERNLVKAECFPYRCAAGSILDSGDYQQAVANAAGNGRLDELRRRRDGARAEGRLYGIGFAAVVEPSISNMGYITTVMTAQERERAGPKGGAPSVATVSIDPLGAVTVSTASVAQGQGHRTVLAQVVGDVLGLPLEAVRAHVEHDTAKDAWSIASGNYASRFSGAVAGTAHLAAVRLRERLAKIASPLLNVPETDLVFEDGAVFAHGNPDNTIPFRRLVGAAHWSPGMLPEGAEAGLRETAFWSMPELEPPDADDRVNSSGAYGFIFDFCGAEVDRDTGQVRIDHYVTMHDAGRRLNPALVDGQIRGGFAHAVGAALYEEFAYSDDGNFLAGTFADYLVPTACEVPDPEILHMESPSPFTPLGAKGVGEGNCMSTPVCLANAVADALSLERVELPMTPGRVSAWIDADEPPPPKGHTHTAPRTAPDAGGRLRGKGEMEINSTPSAIWARLLDPESLADAVPGCESVERVSEHHFKANVGIGVGPVRGRFAADIELFDLVEGHSLSMRARATGPLGTSEGEGHLELNPTGLGTQLRYTYEFSVGGKVAAIGARMLEGTARSLVTAFLQRLAGQPASGLGATIRGWLGQRK